jgi:hypothetical protein
MHLYVGLVHYPVYNRNRETIASAVTTVDLHDIARVARTYGAKRYFIITPLRDQQQLVARVVKHWTQGFGAVYNNDRKEALGLIRTEDSLEKANESITRREGAPPLLIATDAKGQSEHPLTYGHARRLMSSDRPIHLIFGTAWGLEDSVLSGSHYVLEPIKGATGYRHLSVRCAVAIILDRLISG